MPEDRSHKATANRIARKYGVKYDAFEGADIKSFRATVEVETLRTLFNAPTQLQGYRGPVYIAGTNRETVDKALDLTKGTTIGVMDSQGNIIKRSTRKR